LAGEAEEEVNRVMEEITAGLLAPAGSVPTKGPERKAPAEVVQEPEPEVAEDAEDEELERIRSRLQAL
jgi:division protein CdvB (Snf7/Vps24/ESCRT-III family)